MKFNEKKPYKLQKILDTVTKSYFYNKCPYIIDWLLKRIQTIKATKNILYLLQKIKYNKITKKSVMEF